ncbi:MAG: HAD family hydrolase [Deltaproteobacteria bacterium]|jgi:phosphoglycolate phosphatase|nr:HAD family hydrolase [Deltaproteobacteria bacterium]
MTPAALFDLDGTILNTLADLRASLNRALKSLGFPARDAASVRSMVGNGISNLIRVALPEKARDEETRRKAQAAFKEDYAARQLEKTVPYPGIPLFFKEFQARGWPLGVLSNKDHENAVTVTTHYFPNVFQIILGVSPSRPPKPNPEGALEAARALGRSPEDIYYFGDSRVDMALATAVGFFPVGVSWGFQGAAAVREGGARIVLDSPQDFWRALDSPL